MSNKSHAPDIEIALSPKNIRQENGRCWAVNVANDFGLGDDEDNTFQSRLTVFENGKPLGPAHALHSRIREYGRGLYSHWKGSLLFSSSDGTSPVNNGRTYTLKGPHQTYKHVEGGTKAKEQENTERPLFPRLEKMREVLEEASLTSILNSRESSGGDPLARIRMLEAKIEYLLDDVYNLKSLLRWHNPTSEMMSALHRQQIDSFNFQWRRLPYDDTHLGNPAWREIATDDLCSRVERPPEWFKNKKTMDCGCGSGRFTWAMAKLGAMVTAFDTSENALTTVRKECQDFSNVTTARQDILEPMPFDCDYDLVWSYGVIAHTGDFFGGLKNIARHVRSGGQIYFMAYAEPGRSVATDYAYYHELMTMRQALTGCSYEERAKILSLLEGESNAHRWFDAISSQINDLYTVEELYQMLDHLGFEDIRRTRPDERNHNMIATKKS